MRGNDTYVRIATTFGSEAIPEGLLDFPLTEIATDKTDRTPALLYDYKTGEVLCEEPALSVSPEVEKTSLYRLWHTIYSISDMEECAAALTAKFPGINPEVAGRLAAIDFTRQGFSNKSAKAIRRILPYLRRVWGWEDVLMQLQLPRYREIEGATEWVEYTRDGQTRRAEHIVGWSKRDDQMAQTIRDSGTVARKTGDGGGNLLERYIASERPFTTAEVLKHAAGILVSVKSGKRVATPGVRKAGPRSERRVVQRVLVPRGPLNEDSIYGRIPNLATGKPAYVIRYPLSPKFDKTDKIVDPTLREAVRSWLADGAKSGEPFRWNGQTVRNVRCNTGLKPAAFEAVRHDPQTGEPIGFVKSGNNHHIAFYTDPAGNPQSQICTFWHAVERKRMGLPVIIRNPSEAWDIVQSDMERFAPGFLEKLPAPEWRYAFSLQQNEMVILGLDPDVVHAAIGQGDYKLLGPHLYRMRSMSADGNKLDLWFRQQYETQPQKETHALKAGRASRIRSYSSLQGHKIG